MDALLVSIVIALITASSGYLALKTKADDKQVTLVTGVLSSHTEKLDKRITELENRERAYIERITVVENHVANCEAEKDLLQAKLMEINANR